MKIDPLLISRCKNNKQRKLSNIRTRNALNNTYRQMKACGEIRDYKIKVVIRNRVQSAGIWIVPITTIQEVSISLNYKGETDLL